MILTVLQYDYVELARDLRGQVPYMEAEIASNAARSRTDGMVGPGSDYANDGQVASPLSAHPSKMTTAGFAPGVIGVYTGGPGYV